MPQKYATIYDYRGLTYVRSFAEHLQEAFGLPAGVYNFGSENDKNVYDTACEFLSAMNMEDRFPDMKESSDIKPPRDLRMDCSKIRKYGINFESTVEGIQKYAYDYHELFSK